MAVHLLPRGVVTSLWTRRLITTSLRVIAWSVTALSISGCGDFDHGFGAAEPLSVEGAVFHWGELPGAPPEAADPGGPRITAVELSSGIVRRGQIGRVLMGRTTDDAFAIALRFPQVGTGYWLLPAGAPDPAIVGERVFETRVDFHELEAGNHALRFVAFDEQGDAGRQRELTLCVASEVPDNLNACDETRVPPAWVISLTWDQNADLDLVLTGPNGALVDRKRTGDLNDPSRPALDRDSNAGCLVDGRRRESVVFGNPPPSGEWHVYANLFDACDAPSVAFRVELYTRIDHGDGTYGVAREDIALGQLLNTQANGGDGPALFVTTVTFP